MKTAANGRNVVLLHEYIVIVAEYSDNLRAEFYGELTKIFFKQQCFPKIFR